MSLFKEWFTHNRSERVGITALACILMLVIVIPSFFPERRFPPENTEELKLRIDAFHAELAKADVGGDHSFTGYANSANGRLSASTNQQTEPELFYFDPNTCDSASFCRMGFSPKQTAVIMRYRAKGGQFRVKEDFKKMFVVSDEMYAELEKYIQIKPSAISKTEKNDFERNTDNEIRNPIASDNSQTEPELFNFDPNTCDSASFCRMGFSPKQTAVIMRYRAKGGQFRVKEDFKKMFVVSDEMYAELEKYIQIKPSAISKIELNAADTSKLKRLRGIGSYYARRIVEYRSRLGGFYSLDQLKEIKGIDEERLAQFAHQAEVNSALIVKIDLNAAAEEALHSHPYISSSEAKAIVKHRNKKGKIASAQELIDNKLLTPEIAEKLKYYLEF